MIQKIILLCVIASAFCQYPRQRAPPLNSEAPAEAYEDYDDYSPQIRRQSPPQHAPQPPASQNRRNSDILRPATVHYVNIGAELAGDYKFGYDTGKGEDGQSFREETRLPDGSVEGAYGYVDETGKQRIVRYVAGKDGFKVLKDGESATNSKSASESQPAPAPRSASVIRPAPAPRSVPVRQSIPVPQQTYRPQAAAYAPQPRPVYRPEPVESTYRAPPATQPAYRAPPAAQPAYRAPPAVQPAYRAPPAAQQAYGAPPAAEPSYVPRPQLRLRAQAPRQQSPPPKEDYDESEDYDYPNNDISERRLVIVDTSLFNYNIGTSHSKS